MESTASAALRAAILSELSVRVPSGEITTRETLLGFEVDGKNLPLIDYSRGIRNPRQLDSTLSIVSSVDGPYGDESIAPGLWRYDFRSGGSGGDNTKLIAANTLNTPVILFRKLKPNIYQAIYPVRIAHVNLADSHVIVSLEGLESVAASTAPSAVEREWAAYLAQRRVHQPAFRAMVLRAYETQCTVCHFRHAELLDAAHIIGDKDEHGDAVVTNGLAMCKIHHAAYDRNFLGIDPDYSIHINKDLLEERDGPMLQHGLQEMHGSTIIVPTTRADRPNRERLATRFAEFQLV